jgi:hypothetical protein
MNKWTLGQLGKTKPKQSQFKANSKPIQSQYEPNSNPNKPNFMLVTGRDSVKNSKDMLK